MDAHDGRALPRDGEPAQPDQRIELQPPRVAPQEDRMDLDHDRIMKTRIRNAQSIGKVRLHASRAGSAGPHDLLAKRR